MEFVAATTEVKEGEAVVTSGLAGSTYPPEIPVGKVRSFAKPPGAVQQEITIDPVVDISRLEFVKVLLWGVNP